MEQKIAKRARRTHSVTFKTKVALAALTGDKTLAELVPREAIFRQKPIFAIEPTRLKVA